MSWKSWMQPVLIRNRCESRQCRCPFSERKDTWCVCLNLAQNLDQDFLVHQIDHAGFDKIAGLFRFIRSQGAIGELLLRDLYAHSKELRAPRAV